MLKETRPARILRLDGVGANTAEFLNLYAEMFGLTVERSMPPVRVPGELVLIDLPGTDPHDPEALEALSRQMKACGSPRLHLVLNAAYDTQILLQQVRAFAPLGPEDVSFTHLDEETRKGKLWDFVFGTNCSLRFFSAGQKIPSELVAAEPGMLFPARNP